MPPEQFDGERVDARADVFALGVVLFQMLTGDAALPREQRRLADGGGARGQMLRASELRPR